MSDAWTPTFDPWVGDVSQSHRRKAYCRVWVGTREVTDKLQPFLLSLRILDGMAPGPGCEVELDDRDGRLDIPKRGEKVKAIIGWMGEAGVVTFEGAIHDVESSGQKEEGRKLYVKCTGGNFTHTAIQSPMQGHAGAGAPPGQSVGEPVTFLDWISQAAARAQIDGVSVHPTLAAITRHYWSQNNESFLNLGERLRREFGATFRMVNGIAEFSIPGYNANGTRGGVVEAVWGKNLIMWRVHPWIARAAWPRGQQQFFSHVQGTWQTLAQNFGFPLPASLTQSVYQLPAPAPNSQEAEQANGGVSQGQWWGQGRIVLNGEPAAAFNGTVVVRGARPGVDGEWLISLAEHRYSRQGYVTWLDVVKRSLGPFGNPGRTYWAQEWELTREEQEWLTQWGGTVP